MNVLELISTVGRRGVSLAKSFSWGVLLLVSGCVGAESFSDTPEIAPLRVTQKDISEVGGSKRSKVTVVISWKDGNGDLGYVDGDTSTNDVNYFLTIEKRKIISGQPQFIAIKPRASSKTGYNGRFKNLNPEGGTSTTPFKLRGEMAYEVSSPGFTVTPPLPIGTIGGVEENARKGDVLRFQVQIKDRAGNLSNKITTEEVTL